MIWMLAGCVTEGVWEAPDLSWGRMTVQSKVDPYEASTVFPDGSAMRPLPDGVVAVDTVATGLPARSAAVLARGRDRYEVYCVACHGVLGDARTPVAQAMTLRKPPSLHEPRIVALTAEEVRTVIDEGYGLMPAYGPRMAPGDAGAIAWYVRALQLSRHAPLADLPADVRARALQALP
jgi:mono/diheme cytochrome c family protein